MIIAANLTKRYGPTLALDNLSATIAQGAIFGLVGPNGSGKSTLIRLLMGFIFPDAGTIRLEHARPHQIGYVPERPFFPPRCGVAEYLHTAGRLCGLPGGQLHDAVALRLQQVGLSQMAKQPIGACSKGMLQRFALAVALVNDPPLLILDEPMAGLDPAWQKALRDIITALNREGKTVLFSTHRLSDVAEICTHVGILNRGRLRRTGSLSEVLPLRQQVVITLGSIPDHFIPPPGVTMAANVITLSAGDLARKAEVLRRLLDAGVDIQSLSQERATLEEVYLEAIR